MKDFYRNNPQKSEELARVMTKAWNIFGADRIRGALSKFMQSKGFKNSRLRQIPLTLQKSSQKQ